MSARWFIAAAALIATPASAQNEEMPDAAKLADQFEYALVAGDYRMLDVTEDFAYFENGARLDPWDGMWRTTTALEGADPADYSGADTLDYRIELDSPESVVRVMEYEENGVRGVMAYRLLARDGEIYRIDVLPIREEFGGDRGGTITLLQPMLPFTMDGALLGPADPAFAQPGGRVDIEAVSGYFAGLNAGNAIPAFADDCVRRDNGRQATGVADSEVLDPAHPDFRPYALGCGEQLASGFYRNYRAAEFDTYTDPSRGIAVVFARLDQPGTVLSFTTPDGTQIAYPGPRGAVVDADTSEQFDGRILTNMITPMSVNGVFIFKFDETGAISHIDAFYRGAPLGWDAIPG